MIRSRLRHYANHLIAPLGVQVLHYQLERDPFGQLLRAVQHFGIDLTIDVGANAGQYGQELLNAGYAGDLYSIEPQPDAHAALMTRAREVPRWHVLEAMALGPVDGVVTLQVAGNSLSSSVLPMLERHTASAPQSATVGQIEVAQRTLDGVMLRHLRPERKVLLKIDTQGYEEQVLSGATTCLAHISLVQLEMSLVPLYRGQRLWAEMIELMRKHGFGIWSVQPEFCDPVTGQLLQINGLFVQESALQTVGFT
jgi:FkbM family methyltransferase